MVDLTSLVQAAHGGDVVGNLAQQFGISPEQAQSVIASLTPAIAHGLQNSIQSGQGVNEVINHLNDPTHQQTYADPNAAQSPQAAAAGSDLLNSLFGSAGVGQIVNHVAAETGVSASTLNSLAPVLASLVAGGAANAMHQGGFGGMLGQLASAAGQPGGLGSILNTVAGAALNSNAQQGGGGGGLGGGLGGLVGNLVGSLFGGNKAAAPGAAPAGGGIDPALVQAGMGALGNLFQSAQASGALQNILGQVLAKR